MTPREMLIEAPDAETPRVPPPIPAPGQEVRLTDLVPGLEYSPVCYRGLAWDSGFYIARHSVEGTGWYIHARRPEFGGNYVRLVARPNVGLRKHPHYNKRIRRGWRTQREAVAALELLIAALRPIVGLTHDFGRLAQGDGARWHAVAAEDASC